MQTTKITCDCKVCNGMAATVRGDGTRDGKPLTPTMVHNLVRIAHSPMARSASAQKFGPWAA